MVDIPTFSIYINSFVGKEFYEISMFSLNSS